MMTLVDKIIFLIQECTHKFLRVSFYNKYITARYIHLHVIFSFLSYILNPFIVTRKIDVLLKEEINQTTRNK